MPKQPTPHWQPIERLPLIANLIDEQVAGATEQYGTLQEAQARPYVLDDYTVRRVIEVYTAQQDDLWLFEEQLRRWQAEALSADQRQELARLGRQLVELRTVIAAILALAQGLKAHTIEQLLAKSDIEVGLEMLLGRRRDREGEHDE